jgi:ribosome recycling factor
MRDLEKEKLVSEDDHFRGRDEMQELTNLYVKEIDEVGEAKERQIMEV